MWKNQLSLKTVGIGLLVGCYILFGLLLFKNPFSERTLIPNFEPYPDTFHYLIPARNLSLGQPFAITREGRSMQISVGPLYPLTLSPIFLLSSDPRWFYLINLGLAFTGLFLFTKLVWRISQDIWVVNLVVFFYITCYFIYWLPTLAMAENLILVLFLASLWLLASVANGRNVIWAGFLGIAFYGTKYAAISLSLGFLAAYYLKIFQEKHWKRAFQLNLLLVLCAVFGLICLAGFEYIAKGNFIFKEVFNYFSWIFPKSHAGEKVVEVASGSTWFSTAYAKQNLEFYFKVLTGEGMRFLWDYTPLLPKYLIFSGWLGCLIGLFRQQIRWLYAGIILEILTTVIFLSTFYTSDARYIYFAIPSLLLGLVVLLKVMKARLTDINLKPIFYAGLLVLASNYLVFNFMRIKSQVSLNLRYAETPWYYISVKGYNQFFEGINTAKEPILISALPPFFIDFYSNQKYHLLPLSANQEFSKSKEAVWGPEDDYSNLHQVYRKYLNLGYDVYISNYGLGNVAFLHEDFAKIEQEFNLTKVTEGCFNACNIYQLKQKNE